MTLLIPTTLLLTTALPMDSEHYVMLMAHPVTGETISSYKKLMKDPVQTAFGKDFRGMCQGDDKTGAIGTNAMFVMTPTEVTNMPPDCFATYANIIVDFKPQNEDPHRIQNTVGGNLINHLGELTTRTAKHSYSNF